ncbi:MAG: hypothetical protein A2144_12330 [Chloroflexi bacterium RBG_16_50_9]|nr:MAG: hypothetical protein A2144_12330 [Chloroflexi bacterium RBG_16_50_9]
MKREKIWFKILLMVLVSSLFSTCGGDDKSSDRSPATSLGSYKTQEIHAGLEYTIKYKRPSKGDPVEMAYQFFELNKEELGIKNPREEMVYQGKVGESGEVVRVSFGQTFNGIGIKYAGIRVFFTPGGEIRELTGTYYYDINLPTTPSIDSTTAWNIALKDLGFPESTRVVNREYRSEFFRAESLMYEQIREVGLPPPHPDYNARFEGVATRLLIWRSESDGKLHLVWKVCVEQKAAGYLWGQQLWGYYIDAHDGAVLHKGGARSRSLIGH